MRLRTPITVLLSLLLVLAACGADADETAPDDPDAPVTSAPPSTTAAAGGRGWLDGSPAHADDEFADRAGAFDVEEGGADMATAEVAAAEPLSDDVDLTEPPVEQGVPRAGSIDDNADWEAYVAWRAELVALGVPHRELDVTDRAVVVVADAEGAPVVDEAVELLDAGGEVLATVRTRAGGRVIVHPRALGIDGQELRVRIAGTEAVVAAGATTELVAGEAAGPTVVDLHVVLDVTGSMADEIAQLRDAVDAIATGVEALPGRPSLRLGMTVYRDEGDAFVTRTFDLTGDVASFRAALDDVAADGGGDQPEALDEALAEALSAPAWTTEERALRIAIVIADAPPQVGRQVAEPYPASLRRAAEMGVKIHAIAASGTDDVAEYAFREMAAVTDGRFVFLSYGDGATATGASTDTDERPWEELPLDQLVVRLIAEDLAASVVDSGQTPTTTTVPTTTTSTTEPAPGQG